MISSTSRVIHDIRHEIRINNWYDYDIDVPENDDYDIPVDENDDYDR